MKKYIFLFLKVINRLRGKTVCWNEANIWFGKMEERLGQNIADYIPWLFLLGIYFMELVL
jgi:hypothetical protein